MEPAWTDVVVAEMRPKYPRVSTCCAICSTFPYKGNPCVCRASMGASFWSPRLGYAR